MDTFARRRRRLGIAVALLFVAHVWAPSGSGSAFGVFPWDLAYPVVWIGVATLAVLYMTERAWRDVDATQREESRGE